MITTTLDRARAIRAEIEANMPMRGGVDRGRQWWTTRAMRASEVIFDLMVDLHHMREQVQELVAQLDRANAELAAERVKTHRLGRENSSFRRALASAYETLAGGAARVMGFDVGLMMSGRSSSAILVGVGRFIDDGAGRLRRFMRRHNVEFDDE